MAKKRLSKSSLLWLVRSRSYISVADVRRRFNVDSSDDVTSMLGPGGRVYVGLPKPSATPDRLARTSDGLRSRPAADLGWPDPPLEKLARVAPPPLPLLTG